MKKVSELTGAELDYWVAKAAGMDRENGWGLAWISSGNPDRPSKPRCNVAHKDWDGAKVWAPSRNWSQGGPIIEREKIDLEYRPRMKQWFAIFQPNEHILAREWGDTALIAAMRAYVASKYGQEVGDA